VIALCCTTMYCIYFLFSSSLLIHFHYRFSTRVLPCIGVGILQPVFQITDPYLNLFRGLIPPVFGLDLSAILAFVTLNVLTGVTASVGAEITPNDRKRLEQSSYSPFPVKPYYNRIKSNKKMMAPLFMTSV